MRKGRKVIAVVLAILFAFNFGLLLQPSEVYAKANYETEKNDSIGSANKITLNTEWKGAVNDYWSDVDYFKFTLPSDGFISVSMRHKWAENDWELSIIDKDQNTEQLRHRFIGSMDYETSTQNIGLPAGTYYIKITGGYYTEGVEYTLKVNYQESKVWEKEFNNSIGTANTMTLNTKWNGVINDSYYDPDYYKFTLPNDGYISVSMQHKYAESDWEVTIIDKDQNTEHLTHTFIGTMDYETSSQKLGLPAGTYYIKITGEYSSVGIDYTFKVNYQKSSAWEKEFNNSIGTANPITLNTKWNGVISRNYHNPDYYKFVLSKKDTITIKFEHATVTSPSSYDDWRIDLIDKDQNTVLQTTNAYADKTSTTANKISLPAGTYYIKIDCDYDLQGIDYGITVNSTNNPEATSTIWKRLYGTGRYDTMKAIVNEGFTITGGTVVVATGTGFKDALAASGFAGLDKAPVVLTDGKNLSSQARDVLKKLKPKKVYVAGGKAVVTDNVVSQIKTVTGVNPKRIAGQNSAETSAKLALEGKGRWKDSTAIIATNKSFKDALSVAPIAYAKGYPILLADNGKSLSTAVLNALSSIGTKQVIIVGGTGAVTTNVEKQLRNKGIIIKTRLAGDNGVATSAAIAKWGLNNGLTANKMGVATSQNYPDALAGAALCGYNKSVLVLADDKAMANTSFPRPYRDRIKRGYVFGGKTAVGVKTWNALVMSVS